MLIAAQIVVMKTVRLHNAAAHITQITAVSTCSTDGGENAPAHVCLYCLTQTVEKQGGKQRLALLKEPVEDDCPASSLRGDVFFRSTKSDRDADFTLKGAECLETAGLNV